MQAEADYYAKVTGISPWAHVMIITYFDLRPCHETQEKYRQKGLLGSQYLRQELDFILTAKWHKNQYFLSLPYIDYLDKKYPGHEIDVAKMDLEDRKELAKAFSGQLRIPWSIFPFDEKEIFR